MPKRQSETPLFKHTQTKKIIMLLDMLYKPAEIADEIGVSLDTVRRSYIPAGCPTVKDESGHIWINGKDFSGWASNLIRQRVASRRPKLPDGQGYCVVCQKPVLMTNPVTRQMTAVISALQAPCPICGKTVNRIIPNSQRVKKGEEK